MRTRYRFLIVAVCATVLAGLAVAVDWLTALSQGRESNLRWPGDVRRVPQKTAR